MKVLKRFIVVFVFIFLDFIVFLRDCSIFFLFQRKQLKNIFIFLLLLLIYYYLLLLLKIDDEFICIRIYVVFKIDWLYNFKILVVFILLYLIQDINLSCQLQFKQQSLNRQFCDLFYLYQFDQGVVQFNFYLSF